METAASKTLDRSASHYHSTTKFSKIIQLVSSLQTAFYLSIYDNYIHVDEHILTFATAVICDVAKTSIDVGDRQLSGLWL